ncbi:MAG: hypothetical protein U1F16_05410 [Turneriella sp.]
MQRIRDIWQKVSAHRVFVPAAVGVVALTLGILLAFEHTRNIIRIRGVYLLVLLIVLTFPVFAFRFFDPHEDSRPIAAYFLIAGFYFIMLGAPDFFSFLRMLIFERLPSGALKQLLFGIIALSACAGALHYALRLWAAEAEGPRRFLLISFPKFLAYALLHILYLNYLLPFVRGRFGILTVLAD